MKALDFLSDSPPNDLTTLLPESFVAPRYDGLSVGNVPATVGALLGVRIGTLPALDQRLWQNLVGDGIDRVVLFIVDAVGWQRAQAALADDGATQKWLDQVGATVAPMTAIFPSTTSATLTTLWTGVPPAQHGLMGFTLWLRELDAVGNMITMQPRNRQLSGSLLDAGLDVDTFLPVPTVGKQLTGEGVALHAHIGADIRDSGLSQLHFAHATSLTGYAGLGDCMELVRQRVEATAGQRALIVAYWPSFDTLSHLRGPTPTNWDAEWKVFMYALREVFYENLSRRGRERTAAIIIADHGHSTIKEDSYVLLDEHPELADHLLIWPTGDPRAVYLHVRPGRHAEVRNYVEAHMGDAFHALHARDALDAGLWGPGDSMNEVPARIGDMLLLAYGESAFFAKPRKYPLYGMHGSLTPEEALVPWIAWRLDA